MVLGKNCKGLNVNWDDLHKLVGKRIDYKHERSGLENGILKEIDITDTYAYMTVIVHGDEENIPLIGRSDYQNPVRLIKRHDGRTNVYTNSNNCEKEIINSYNHYKIQNNSK